MHIEIIPGPFDPHAHVQQYASHFDQPGKVGAMSMFVGYMRDFNEGDTVSEMFLEHYPGMTEKQLQAICEEIAQQHDLYDTLVVHRVGRILPTEPIVLVSVWSSHRADAFTACREIMEALKTRAPFWKRENISQNTSSQQSETTRWVKKNTPG